METKGRITETKGKSVPHLLTTTWNQNYPYAVGTPYNTAGCMKIAVTQLMYYHKHPSDAYTWSNIRVDWGDYYSQPTTEEISFIIFYI